MTRLLHHPALGAGLALVLGVAAGLFPLWRAAQQISLAPPPAAVVAARQEKAKGWDFWTIEIDNLASELKEEKARLHQHAEQMDLRAGRIEAERAELEKLRQQLEALRAEIGEKVTLASTYSNLSPRAAVAIIRELDDVTAVKILFLMKSDAVGPIFEEMSRTAAPDGTLARRAALLSERLRLIRAAKPATPS
jgi:flagellar motility protein MotE (MotC chaperone)